MKPLAKLYIQLRQYLPKNILNFSDNRIKNRKRDINKDKARKDLGSSLRALINGVRNL